MSLTRPLAVRGDVAPGGCGFFGSFGLQERCDGSRWAAVAELPLGRVSQVVVPP